MEPRGVNDIAGAKQALRRRFRDARAALAREARERIAAGLRDALAALPEIARCRSIHAFWPDADRGEIDLGPLLQAWHDAGVEIVLPRVASRHPPTLTHHVWDGGALARASFGLPEPAPTLPDADLTRIDAVLVPALAVDAAGTRLGYGGGFYDAFLADLSASPSPPLVVCAVPHVCLSRTPLPREPHDVSVHIVVTERGMHRVDGPSVS